MSKHTEIADRMKSIRHAHDSRLDDLAERMDKHEANSDRVFRMYEGELEGKELSMEEMERDINDMRNSFQGGKTDETVKKFPETVKPTTKDTSGS